MSPGPQPYTQAELDAFVPSASLAGDDGWRLYLLLALFDTRDGGALADLIRAAREGYERCRDEEGAWAEFDRLWQSHSSSERLALARKAKP